ncbi:zinc finger domain-containing protein, partial [Salmonella enterica subsp. enterica serovar Enteritidis]
PTHALVAKPSTAVSTSASASTSTDISNEKLTSLTEANEMLNEKMNTMMALFTERLGKYKKGNGFKPRLDVKCFNCGKPGHYAANCWHLKPDQRI